jgi:hypothetical protein
LLRHRLAYPVIDAPYSLSANCRNAGKIFKLISKLHPDAPQTAAVLEQAGVVNRWMFTPGREIETLASAVRDALTILPDDQLVVLTTEPEPVERSILNGLEISLSPQWRWQDAVRNTLGGLATQCGYRGEYPDLSSAFWPSPTDIEKVTRYAEGIAASKTAIQWGVPTPSRINRVTWTAAGTSLSLSRASSRTWLQFFLRGLWVQALPTLEAVTLTPGAGEPEAGEIRLATIPSFKGLESDGVILFIRAPMDEDDATLYVAISRARYLLYLVLDPEARRKHFPYMAHATEEDVEHLRAQFGQEE